MTHTMFTLHTKGLSEAVTLKNLPTLRLTFLIGSLVIIASYFLEPYWPLAHYLPLLPAFGLMLSGVFGFCPMVHVLQWGRGRVAPASLKLRRTRSNE